MEASEIERRLRRLQRTCNFLWIAVALAVVSVAVTLAPPMLATGSPERLRIRELTIVDENGIERVIIGAPLPGQWENGKVNTRRVERPYRQAGVLIFDKAGVERGGYVTEDTSDNALLTLDDKKRQEVLLVTGPDPTSSFRMWIDNHLLELRVDPDLNGPSMRMVRDGKLVLEEPRK